MVLPTTYDRLMTEQQPYETMRSVGAVELRRYPEHVVAETEVSGDFEGAGNRAFRYLFGYKILLYVHGEEITTRDGGGLFDRWRAKFLAHAHAVIAVSSFTRDAMIRLMRTDPGKITLIPNGVDTQKFQVRDPRPELAERYGVRGRRVILSVGRLVPRKGADYLIQAMPAILRACPDAHLLIAGEGPLRNTLETLIEQQKLESYVTLLGEVTDQALADLYAQADLFALPNREMPDGDTEGFGLVFLEANACGKPVVSGRAGGVVDAVIDGVNGLAVDGGDVAAIAAAVTRLLEDKQLYRKLAAGGLDAARRGDWRSRSAEFLALCDRVRGAGTPAGQRNSTVAHTP
jgi:phosphatidylinositol alpha-1,6-mannosyltransferase